MAISHCYWHLVVYNGNWQIYPKICQQIYPPNASWIYFMGCIWQPFCILQKKVGISCYFKIIRVVNNQLAWYSHVRYNPLTPPKHHKSPLTPPHDNYKFQLWGLIFARFHMSYCCESWSWQICQQIYTNPPNASWDIFGSHVGFFKKRWEFPFISE